MNQPIDGTISLQFLRKLAAPASSFDSFGKDPVYVNVDGKLYEIADVSFVSAPHYSHVEIQAGRELTNREARSADRKVIHGWAEVARG